MNDRSHLTTLAEDYQDAANRATELFDQHLPADPMDWTPEALLNATRAVANSLEAISHYDGIKVVLQNDILKGSMGILGDVPSAGMLGDALGCAIIVNDAFLTMSKELQEALLAHEAAHHSHGDIAKIVEMGQETYTQHCLEGAGAGFEMELAADASSKARGLPIKDALEHMLEKIIDLDAVEFMGQAMESLKVRIKAL